MSRPNLSSDDYYQILGCPRNADDALLKKSYRKLAVKWHPDKNPDNQEATENFQKISEAYAVLSDPKKRQMYDQYGKEGAEAAEQGGFPGHGRHGGFGGGMSPHDAEQIFSHLFGGSDPFGFGGGGGGSPFGNIQFGGPGMGGMGGMGGPGIRFSHGGGMPGGFSGGMPRARPPPTFYQKQRTKVYNVLPENTMVTLQNLVSAAHLNGDRGVIKDYIESSGRYKVQLEDSEESLSVKPTNILQHAAVKLHNIESHTSFNGLKGNILAWNTNKQRYSIHIPAIGRVISLKPANIIFDNGTVIKINGVTSRPELNDKYATVKAWNEGSNKYDLQTSAQQILRLKAEFVSIC